MSKKRRYKDITGKTFDQWKVLCRDEEKSTSDSNYWLVQCSCGSVKSLHLSSLMTGASKRCVKCSNNLPDKISKKLTGYKEITGSYWSSVKAGARWRNIDFDITIEYAWGIFLKQKGFCALSNEEITLSKGNQKGTASLDRIDSKNGYVPGNIQWVHKDVNRIKQYYKEEYFLGLCDKISKHQDQLKKTANELIPKLKKYILVDGLNIVVDLRKSFGSWLVDSRDGKKYLDCFGQFASQALGWGHPALVSRIEELTEVSLVKLSHSDIYTEYYQKFNEIFAKTLPEFKKSFFISGGALAVENALKAAFDWKSQKLNISTQEEVNKLDIVHFENAFHGRSGYTLSLTNTDPNKTNFFSKFDWTRLPVDNGELDKLEKILKNNYVAAVIIEPIQGEGGDIHISQNFLYNLRKLTEKYEALLIFDEVQTGFSTGKSWCYQHFNIVPDLIAFAKKVQVGGFASTERLFEIENNVLTKSGRINSTFGADIVDVVRSTIILETIEKEDLLNKSAKTGQYFLKKLTNLGLENVRGRGAMIAFDFNTTEERNNFLIRLSENMIALKCGEKSVRLRPHLTFDIKEVDTAVDFIKNSL